jgi:hypothetical protein
MTDQEKRTRFPDGDTVGPLNKSRVEHPVVHVLKVFSVWALAIGVLVALFWLLFALVSERRAHADETAARIFEVDGECFIDTDLRVTGNKRAACVDRLDTATRLARATMRVNEGRRKK